MWHVWILIAATVSSGGRADVRVGFERGEDRLVVQMDGREVAEYVYRDPKVARPYFANVRTLTGIPVTRNWPVKPEDAQDHIGLHTGIWLAFGDLSGQDSWRLKARVEHVEFLEEPKGGAGSGHWAVRNRYLSEDGSKVVCEEDCRYSVTALDDGYLFTCASTFFSKAGSFWFGEQDEMGLGVRVATPLVVKSEQGGRIVDSDGRMNEAEIWGKVADWVDYGGTIDGRHVGLVVMSHPGNANRSWHHARDYGFVAANPFPRTDGTKRTVIGQGERYRLGYGVFVYDVAEGEEIGPGVVEAWDFYCEVE